MNRKQYSAEVWGVNFISLRYFPHVQAVEISQRSISFFNVQFPTPGIAYLGNHGHQMKHLKPLEKITSLYGTEGFEVRNWMMPKSARLSDNQRVYFFSPMLCGRNAKIIFSQDYSRLIFSSPFTYISFSYYTFPGSPTGLCCYMLSGFPTILSIPRHLLLLSSDNNNSFLPASALVIGHQLI